jgi:hypothetical protein
MLRRARQANESAEAANEGRIRSSPVRQAMPSVCPSSRLTEAVTEGVESSSRGEAKWLRVMGYTPFTSDGKAWVLSNPMWASNGIKARPDGSSTMRVYCRIGGAALKYRAQVDRGVRVYPSPTNSTNSTNNRPPLSELWFVSP